MKSEKLNEFVKRNIEKSTLKVTPEEWIKKNLIISSVITVLTFVVTIFLTTPVKSVAWTVSIFIFIISYLMFNLKYSSFKKAREIEEMLPEALDIISSGVRSGLSTKDSIQSIIRDEFEPLASEISKAYVEQSTGATLTESLNNAAERVESDLFEKTMFTLTRSIDSGANVDEVASSLAKNITEVRSLRKDIRSSTVTYTMFLSFASLAAAPILFALSSFLVETNAEIASRTGSATASGGGIPSSFLQLTSQLPPIDVLNNFFIAILVITSISSSIAIGIVNKGHYKEGLKIAPFFVIIALIIYFFASSTVSSFFGI